MPLSDEQKAEYVDDGDTCPYCGAGQAVRTNGPLSARGGVPASAAQFMHCAKCGRTWTDIYTLTRIEEDES